MVFIETTSFSRLLPQYLNDDEYLALQHFLMDQPDAGDLIQGAGGLRKLRWSKENKGKRSGTRVIYYWHISEDQIFLFTIYAKNEVIDLSAKEKKALRKLLEDWDS